MSQARQMQGRQAGTRRRVLMLSLLATLVATAWAYLQDEADLADLAQPAAASRRLPPNGVPAATRHTDKPSHPSPAEVSWQATPRTAWLEGQDPKGWGPPPPPPAPPPSPAPSLVAAAAPPQAPAFNYQWIGVLDDGESRALLVDENGTLAVKVGDVIGAAWRVDAIRESSLHLTWMPGQQARTLNYRNPP